MAFVADILFHINHYSKRNNKTNQNGPLPVLNVSVKRFDRCVYEIGYYRTVIAADIR